MKWTSCFVLPPLATLVACATGYEPRSMLNNGGYHEARLAPEVYRVGFVGNEQITLEQTEDFARLRAAELCLSARMPHMVLSQFSSQHVESGASLGRVSRTYGAHGYGTGRAEHSDGVLKSGSVPGKTLFRPVSDLTVTCVARPIDGSVDAASVAESLRTRYSIRPTPHGRRARGSG
jgi:hypothetical protein